MLQGPKVEQIAKELTGTFSNHDAVRLCNALQARRKVWGLADDGLLLSRTRPNQIADYDQSGGNAHTGLHLNTGLQPAHRFD